MMKKPPKMADEIIRELWRIKEEIAREHGNDIDRLVAYFRSRPRQPGERYVDLSDSGRATTEQERSAERQTRDD